MSRWREHILYSYTNNLIRFPPPVKHLSFSDAWKPDLWTRDHTNFLNNVSHWVQIVNVFVAPMWFVTKHARLLQLNRIIATPQVSSCRQLAGFGVNLTESTLIYTISLCLWAKCYQCTREQCVDSVVFGVFLPAGELTLASSSAQISDCSLVRKHKQQEMN